MKQRSPVHFVAGFFTGTDPAFLRNLGPGDGLGVRLRAALPGQVDVRSRQNVQKSYSLAHSQPKSVARGSMKRRFDIFTTKLGSGVRISSCAPSKHASKAQ